jgi:hypothetical protein
MEAGKIEKDLITEATNAGFKIFSVSDIVD